MEVWPISQAEAARRAGVSATVAGFIIKSYEIPVLQPPNGMKFRGLSQEAFERFSALAAPFRKKQRGRRKKQRRRVKTVEV